MQSSQAGRSGVRPVEEGAMATTVQQMLSGGSEVHAVRPDATVFEALQLMADKNIGAVLVVEADRRLVGILSERDYARKVMLMGRSSKEISVKEIMTTEVVCVDLGWTVDQCLALMDLRQIRHLPVTDNGRTVGVVSMRTVVHAKLAEQQFTIDELSKYISRGA
jgi:CBS domain-containing protein